MDTKTRKNSYEVEVPQINSQTDSTDQVITEVITRLAQMKIIDKKKIKYATSVLTSKPSRPLMLQQNWTTALNEFAMADNAKITRTYTQAGPDHNPVFTVEIRYENSLATYTSRATGPTKKAAHNLGAYRNLTLIYAGEENRCDKLTLSPWIRDLLKDGDIEANPGPNRQLLNAQTVFGSISTNIIVRSFPAPPTNGISIFVITSNFTNRAVNLIFRSTESSWEYRMRTHTSQLPLSVPCIDETMDVSYWSSTSSSPGDELISITQFIYGPIRGFNNGTPLYVNTNFADDITARISNVPLPVSIVNPGIDVNVTNSSIPIEIPTGDILTVQIDNSVPLVTSISESSLPLWVSDVGKKQQSEYSDPPTDLTTCGDIESNPGPSNDYNDEEEGYFSNEIQVPAMKNGKTCLGIDDKSIFLMLEPVSGPIDEQQVTETKMNVEQRIIEKSKLNGNIGISFRIVSIVYNIPTSNQYNLLHQEIDDCEVIHTEVANYGKERRPQKQTSKDDKARLPSERPSPRNAAVQAKVELESYEQKKNRFLNVIARIVNKAKAHPECMAKWFMDKGRTKFAYIVAQHLFGMNWTEKESFCPLETLAYGMINNLPLEALKVKILQFDSKYSEYKDDIGYNNHRADLELAKLHNKNMHAYNGNPFTQTMTDVDDAPNWQKLLSCPLSNYPRITGIEMQALLTNIVGNENPNQTALFYQDRARGNVVQPDNTIQTNCVLPLPSTNLVPREYFIPGATPPIQPDTQGNNVTDTNIAEFYNSPIMPTELSQNLSNAVKNANTTVWRRDNTMLSGFSVFDIAGLNTTLLQKGLSMERFCLVLDMLHSIMCLDRVEGQVIPASSWSLINNSFVPDISPPILGCNDSPVPGENVGGNNPIFPWGGSKGQVAFHVTPETVPIGRRAEAIFMPPALLQSEADGELAIPLFVMGFAEWPWCIFTFKKSGTFNVDGSILNHVTPFVPTQSWTHIPGKQIIDIILPRGRPDGNPTTQASANSMVLFKPACGNQSSANLAANSLLDINYVGGPDTTYPLTDFLYTWWQQYDAVSIKNFIGRLGVMIGIKDTMYAVHEMNITMTQQFPSMICSNPNNPGSPRIYPINDIQEGWLSRMHQVNYASHFRVTNAGGPFPLTGKITANYRVFETNPTVWNKVCVGLATADNIQSEGLHELPPYLGDNRNHFWERLEVIPQATAWGAFYVICGMTVEAWNAAYVSTRNKWMQAQARNLFATTQNTGTLVPPKFGALLRRLMEQMHNRSPSTLISSMGEIPVPITHFDRWLPSSSFASVYNFDVPDSFPNQYPGELYCFIPTIIPDFWYQFTSTKTPRMICAYPPPFGANSTQGYRHDVSNKKLTVHRISNRASTDIIGVVGPYMEDVKAVYPINAGPKADDNIKWNYRLWFLSDQYIPGDFSAQPVRERFPTVEGVFQPVLKPVARSVFLFDGERYPLQVPQMSTVCFPDISIDGTRIIPFLRGPESVIRVQTCNRANRLFFATWLLQNVYLEPELQAISDDVEDIFDQYCSRATDIDTFLDSTGVSNIMAKPSVVAQQAVQPETLPSVMGDTTPQDQPSSLTGTKLNTD